MDFAWISDPTALAALATLVVMEIVLGIDNLIFISILTNKTPVSAYRGSGRPEANSYMNRLVDLAATRARELLSIVRQSTE